MFNDSLNFVRSSLDAVVKGTDQEDLKIAEKKKIRIQSKEEAALEEGDQPYEYIT